MPFVQLPNGCRLYVESRGQGRPVVFVHGWSASHELWNLQVEHLQRFCRTIVYDQRGHGRSSECAGPFTMDAYSDDLAQLLETLALEDVVLVGWSMGAVIAIDLFRSPASERIAKLVLLSGSPRLTKATGWPHGFDGAELRGLRQAMAADRAGTTRAFLGALMRDGQEDAVLDLVTRIALEVPLAAANESFQSELEADLRGVLEDIRVPTLVVHGDVDHTVCLGASGYMLSQLRRGEQVLLPRCGHFGPLEAPLALNGALERFVGE
jgi:pimeloyl-ACP methyl ester carboxylesterase